MSSLKNSQAIKTIISNVDKMIIKRIQNADYDKSYSGTVKEVLENNKYKINIHGAEYTASCIGYSPAVGEAIHAVVSKNNNADIYIIPKSSSTVYMDF